MRASRRSTAGKSATVRAPYAASAHVSRNLLNYPLARDRRLKINWRRVKSKSDERAFQADLPGDNIAFKLPRTFTDPRAPDGFDVLVLLWLLAEARMRDTSSLTVPSVASVLRFLGVSENHRNHRRFMESLRLWAALSVVFSNWYGPGQVRARKTLGPPVVSLSEDPKPSVVLSAAWLAAGAGYFKKADLPLPTRAVTQNLILHILTWSSNPELNEPGAEFKRGRSLSGLRNYTLGCSGGARAETYAHAVPEAADWFAARRLRLEEVINEEGLVTFFITNMHKRAKGPSSDRSQLGCKPVTTRTPYRSELGPFGPKTGRN